MNHRISLIGSALVLAFAMSFVGCTAAAYTTQGSKLVGMWAENTNAPMASTLVFNYLGRFIIKGDAMKTQTGTWLFDGTSLIMNIDGDRHSGGTSYTQTYRVALSDDGKTLIAPLFGEWKKL